MKQSGKQRWIRLAAAAALLSSFCLGSARADSMLREGDSVAVCGDSITEQKLYSVFIEDYLRMCQPTKVDVMQFGWSGERAVGLAGRMDNDVLPFHPTLVTLCYGMNDGRYRPVTDQIRKEFVEPMTQIVDKFLASGARVIVGTPGAVDTTTFKRTSATPEQYNENLQTLGADAKALAEQKQVAFADVHGAMMQAMQAAKAKYGQDYPLAGGDGVHPGRNGHLVMAYAFLKAMGLDGNIGQISVDLNQHTATASDGHTVDKVEGNTVQLTSTRYPFCLSGDPKNPGATAGVVEFFPFNQDLNRLTLKVVGPAGKYRVKWGDTTREYTADQLKEGVNLAADFLTNPFSAPFLEVERKIQEKQAFETAAFKNLIHTLGDAKKLQLDDQAVQALVESVRKRHAELNRQVAEAVQPVRHTITIEPAE